MYYVIKSDIAHGFFDLIEVKYYIFEREGIKIERNERDGWNITAYNRQLYLNKTPVKIAQYSNEYTQDEVFSDISIKNLCKRFGYILTKEVE